MVQQDQNRGEVLFLGNDLPGGLITAKNKSSKTDEERPIFKAPSKLGLEELARKKRQAKSREDKTEKKVKLDWEEEEKGVNEVDEGITKYKQYRPQRMETPSHGGGVSDSALKRLEERKKKDRRSITSDRDSMPPPDTPRRGGLFKRSQWTEMTPSRNPGSFTPRNTPGNMTPMRRDSGYSRKSTGNATAVARRSWESMTPSVRSTAYDELALEYPEEFEGDENDRRRWEEEQAQLDREWYQMEDGGVGDQHICFILKN